MHNPSDAATMRFYAENAPTYVGSGANGQSRHLPSFLKLLSERSKVLELGCGGGRDAEAMIAAGHDVEPTDGTPEIANQAEQRLGIPVRVMRFDELDAVEKYDAVWANASLLHVPRSELSGVLRKVWTALKRGGVHLASYKAGGQEGRDSFGRYYSYLSAEEVKRAYDGAGPWDVLSCVEYMGGGYQSATKGPWVAITLRRPL